MSSFPTHLPGRLHNYVGSARSAGLRREVEALLDEGHLEPGQWPGGNLVEASHRFEATMRNAHPELSGDAIRALAWYWSYTNK